MPTYDELPLPLDTQTQTQTQTQHQPHTPVNQGFINFDRIPSPPRLIRQNAENIQYTEDIARKLTFDDTADGDIP